MSELTAFDFLHDERPAPHSSIVACSPALPFAECISTDEVASDANGPEEDDTPSTDECTAIEGEETANRTESRKDVAPSTLDWTRINSSHRSNRTRRPSVRLQFPGVARVDTLPTDVTMNLQPPAGLTPIEVPSREPTPVVPTPVSERAEVGEVLTAGGDRLNILHSETTLVDTSAVEQVTQVLTNIPNLICQQGKYPFLAEIRSRLGGSKSDSTTEGGNETKESEGATREVDEGSGAELERGASSKETQEKEDRGEVQRRRAALR